MASKRIFASLLVFFTFAIYAMAPAYGQSIDRIRKQFEAPPEPKSTFDGEINRPENRPVDHSYSFDNRGSRFFGPYYGSASVGLNSLFGPHDKTRIRAILATQSEEMRYFEIFHEERLGSAGTALQMSYNRTRTRPGFTFKTAFGTNVEGESQELSFTLSHPFIRLHDENLSGWVSFLWHKSEVDLAFNALFEDRLRVAKLGVAYDFVDGFDGLNLLQVEVSQGLDILNESTSGSNDNVGAELSIALGRSDFTKLTAYASRLQRLPGDLSIFLAATGQYSRTRLLSLEEFGFGGEYFGRAFDFDEITGDHGMAGKVELRYGRGAHETPMIKDYQVYAFWDYGAVWRIDPVARIDGGGHHSLTGSSAGIGLRFTMTDNISGSIEVDKPLTRDVRARSTNGEKPRIFFRLSANF